MSLVCSGLVYYMLFVFPFCVVHSVRPYRNVGKVYMPTYTYICIFVHSAYNAYRGNTLRNMCVYNVHNKGAAQVYVDSLCLICIALYDVYATYNHLYTERCMQYTVIRSTQHFIYCVYTYW